MMKKICVVTGTRAEFGLLTPVIKKIHLDDELELQLVVTGSHLIPELGNTQSEIEAAGLPIYAKIPISMGNDSNADMAVSTGEAMAAFANYFKNHRPDMLVVLGDRFEIFAASTAAALQNIPIAHIHGGETTEGAVDEFLRHSITKMSHLHFTACKEYQKRVIQLGESPDRVHNVGALGVENVMNLPQMSMEELSDSLSFDLFDKDYSVVTFHSVTQEEGSSEQGVRELIEAMNAFPEMNYIITKANADAGGRMINQIWEKEAEKHSNWIVVASLGAKRYLSALKGAKMMLGNSSSGILEAPAVKIPTVNIGNRQKGRMMAESIINCETTKAAIKDAMEKALNDKFRKKIQAMEAPFGGGDTSGKIIHILKQWLNEQHKSITKSFYDVRIEI